jgi:hypothetical protein
MLPWGRVSCVPFGFEEIDSIGARLNERASVRRAGKRISGWGTVLILVVIKEK